ncbi:MAG: C40 family peptidase, partial [Burkholderiales bacterium]|nr:C40 family peptidase [Burkholderiales bacterium]
MTRRALLRRLASAVALVAAGTAARALAQAAPPDAPAAAAEPTFTSRAGELLFRAMALLGTPYRRGGGSPETGFDCSGFVGYLFREVMGMRLPRSAWEIWRHGEEVAHDA